MGSQSGFDGLEYGNVWEWGFFIVPMLGRVEASGHRPLRFGHKEEVFSWLGMGMRTTNIAVSVEVASSNLVWEYPIN